MLAGLRSAPKRGQSYLEYVAVGGPIGVGKSTLVGRLAATLGWDVVSESPSDSTYLRDIFGRPDRWAFEVQTSFLIRKAAAIKRALATGRPFILDRSLFEDVSIFARLFADSAAMDERAWATYSTLAAYVLDSVPHPAAVVYLTADHETLADRLRVRRRGDLRLYPVGHLQRVVERYSGWSDAFDEELPGHPSSHPRQAVASRRPPCRQTPGSFATRYNGPTDTISE